jgi:uncharacterized protein YecE (DUF72 family)
MEWKIGCSGYHYPEWKGMFYPGNLPQRRWFEYYGEHFKTLELNVTYYKFPRVESLKSWYTRSPQDFSFTLKAPRHITHFKKFRDAQQMLHDFNGAARDGLAEKLGCVLFQFPSNFRYEAERLERITDMLDASLHNVVEFRHQSWWDPRVFEVLNEANISFCGMSHPSLPDDTIATTDTLYYRFHGIPHLYKSKYDLDKLEQTVRGLLSHPEGKRAFIYFNNTADGHAITNASQLQEICELVH